MDTLLYDASIPVISSLQKTLNSQADYMQLMSVVFDPKYAFLIYSPIAFLLNPKVGKKLILTTVIAEWLNQILKWLLHGERPYWYVHSSGRFDPQQVPIKQFPITCELGPGHPSGHAMLTAAVWYIIFDSLIQAYNKQNVALTTKPNDETNHHHKDDITSRTIETNHKKSNNHKPTTTTTKIITKNLQVKLSLWTLYIILLSVVSVSRVFLGCHFPHQCLAGATLGLLVAKWISKLETKALHFIITSIFLLTTAFGTFGLLQVLGFDPAWTIKLATTHCVKREYIHLDTAPFFSIMRYCGFALGCGLGLMFPLKDVSSSQMEMSDDDDKILVGQSKEFKFTSKFTSSSDISWFSVKIIMALLMARLVDNLCLFVSHSNLPLFYSSAFFAYTGFSFAFINL